MGNGWIGWDCGVYKRGKTTDKWELVVKVYAKSGGIATIAEPVMMVEADG